MSTKSQSLSISVEREVLREAIAAVMPAVSRKATTPITSHLLLEADGVSLRITGTSLDETIERVLPCNTEQSGSFTINAQLLLGLINRLDGNDISITAEDGIVHLTCGKAKARFTSFEPENFPVTPKIETFAFAIAASELKRIISKAAFCLNKEQILLGNMAGLRLEIHEGLLRCFATDRVRLFCYNNSANTTTDVAVTIPAKTALHLQKVLDEDVNVDVCIQGDTIAFSMDGLKVISSTVAGGYPDVNRVIPKNADITAKINRADLYDCIQRAESIVRGSTFPIRLLFEDGDLTIRTINPNVGEFEESMPIVYENEPLQIGVNPAFLRDVLNAIDDDIDDVVFSMKDANSPFIVQPLRDGEIIENEAYVIMPMRIQ